jgi:hypothetical protein
MEYTGKKIRQGTSPPGLEVRGPGLPTKPRLCRLNAPSGNTEANSKGKNVTPHWGIVEERI